MGRAPCCDKGNVKKGPWSPEEDAKLKTYIEEYGTGGNWIALPQKIGLKRCGKSCRLRWLNYLRPNIKHGGFSEEEDNIICSLYISIGSRWSVIAAQLPGRTDNDIKNYWNTRLKKKLFGRLKQSNLNRLSTMISTHDPKDVNGNDMEEPQALSNATLERLQLYVQLQSLQNPSSFYSNPIPLPNLLPIQEKLIQTLQSDLNNNQNPNPILQAVFPNDQTGQGEQMLEDYMQNSYPKVIDQTGNSLNLILSSETSIGNCSENNLIDQSTLVPNNVDGTELINAGYDHQVLNIEAEIDAFLGNRKIGFRTQLEQDDQVVADHQIDWLKEMSGSRDGLVWWSNEFDTKSASTNSWDHNTSVLQPEGIFQDYNLGYNL